eukprot:Rhum_TRINITY_DN16785_c0_g1::Rhum_TRINITY_DN16785_c0_g1_i1::g.164389::m.164389
MRGLGGCGPWRFGYGGAVVSGSSCRNGRGCDNGPEVGGGIGLVHRGSFSNGGRLASHGPQWGCGVEPVFGEEGSAWAACCRRRGLQVVDVLLNPRGGLCGGCRSGRGLFVVSRLCLIRGILLHRSIVRRAFPEHIGGHNCGCCLRSDDRWQQGRSARRRSNRRRRLRARRRRGFGTSGGRRLGDGRRRRRQFRCDTRLLGRDGACVHAMATVRARNRRLGCWRGRRVRVRRCRACCCHLWLWLWQRLRRRCCHSFHNLELHPRAGDRSLQAHTGRCHRRRRRCEADRGRRSAQRQRRRRWRRGRGRWHKGLHRCAHESDRARCGRQRGEGGWREEGACCCLLVGGVHYIVAVRRGRAPRRADLKGDGVVVSVHGAGRRKLRGLNAGLRVRRLRKRRLRVRRCSRRRRRCGRGGGRCCRHAPHVDVVCTAAAAARRQAHGGCARRRSSREAFAFGAIRPCLAAADCRGRSGSRLHRRPRDVVRYRKRPDHAPRAVP